MMLMRTFTGKLVDPVNLQLDDIEIADIAHSLSQICRYNGHGAFVLSVAQHSVAMSALVPAIMQQAGIISDPIEYQMIAAVCLMHDSCEAYLSDIPTPLKIAISYPEQIENHTLQIIFEKYGLVFEEYERIKIFDKRICENEKDALWPGMTRTPTSYLPLPGYKVVPWTSQYAEKCFLATFKDVVQGVYQYEH